MEFWLKLPLKGSKPSSRLGHGHDTNIAFVVVVFGSADPYVLSGVVALAHGATRQLVIPDDTGAAIWL